MQGKMDKLNQYLKDMLTSKRLNRQKLSDIREDIISFKLSKESLWDRVTSQATTGNKSGWQDECAVLEELIAKAESDVKAESKKAGYLQDEMKETVLRGLNKQEKH